MRSMALTARGVSKPLVEGRNHMLWLALIGVWLEIVDVQFILVNTRKLIFCKPSLKLL